jgi:hypothetical protein
VRGQSGHPQGVVSPEGASGRVMLSEDAACEEL